MIGNLNISTAVAEDDSKHPLKIFSIYSDLIKQLQSDGKLIIPLLNFISVKYDP